MCGIVGYVGREEAVPVLLQGLYKLEYRGYDSAGVAVLRPEGGRYSSIRSCFSEVWEIRRISSRRRCTYLRITPAGASL